MTAIDFLLPPTKTSKINRLRWVPVCAAVGRVRGLMDLEVKGERQRYRVEETATQWSGRAFAITKKSTGERYSVFVAGAEVDDEGCDCPGYTYHKHCKHLSAVKAIIGGKG